MHLRESPRRGRCPQGQRDCYAERGPCRTVVAKRARHRQRIRLSITVRKHGCDHEAVAGPRIRCTQRSCPDTGVFSPRVEANRCCTAVRRRVRRPRRLTLLGDPGFANCFGRFHRLDSPLQRSRLGKYGCICEGGSRAGGDACHVRQRTRSRDAHARSGRLIKGVMPDLLEFPSAHTARLGLLL